VPVESTAVDFDKATASFRLADLSLPDWGTLRYALAGTAHTPSVVTFDVRWNGTLARAPRRQEEQRWVGEYIQTTATIEWSVRQEGFSFKSDPRETSKNQAAVIGRHRNGAFFA
jgi:hypothetical protein